VAFTARPGAHSFIDIAPGDSGVLRSATLNGVAIDVGGYHGDQGLTLSDLAADNTLVVEADCTYSQDGEGLYRFVDPTDREIYLYTQFETAAAKRVFACFDQPDIKASFGLTVIAPRDWVVVSNTATTDIGDAGSAKEHHFPPTARIASYVVALIAGPYAGWADIYTDPSVEIEIPLRIFCRKSLQHAMDAQDLFDLTKQGFTFYHNKFGVRYPFGKYDQVFCPAYNAGAMENVAAVTFTDDYVFRGRVAPAQKARRAETLLHEMAHMWFGDLVTMKWWDDLWLNEAFATWASNLCLAEGTGFTEAWATFANVQKPNAYRQDELPTTHPVADVVPSLDLVEANFDDITYIKGASILKQLVAFIGIDPFLAGLRDYFTTYAYGNAELADLLTALEKQAPGRDLHEWARQWLQTTGINTLSADFGEPAPEFTTFAVMQGGATPGNGETRIQRIQIGVYDDDGSGKLCPIHPPVPVDIAGNRTDVPQLQAVRRGKLILLNDNDDTYCALSLDPTSRDTALTRVGDIADRLARAQVWSVIWQMVRNCEYRARDFASLVSSLVPTECQLAVVANLILQAQTAMTYDAEPAWAAEHGWPDLADRLLKLAYGAEKGSDEQLVYINALGADRLKERQRSSVLQPRHTEVLSALLDSADPAQQGLPGLCLDNDLRWRIVIALATNNVSDADRFIDAQAAKDPSETGRLNAAQANAARPVKTIKETVWHQISDNKDLPNSDARALVAGFAAPGHTELLAPYQSRYFDSIVKLWRERPEPVATTIAKGLYPAWDISQGGIAAAQTFLGRRDVPATLTRWIREGQADVSRALKARAADSRP
jgi:aminopeptidase N